jgi:hypothetical protein
MDSFEWEKKYVAEYKELATFLMEYGGVVSPNLMGLVWKQLQEYREQVVKRPPSTDQERAQVERDVDLILVLHASSPAYRAQLIFQALHQPQLQVCSHLIELATFHYYKADYLSCALVLLPAVEAMLRAYVGSTEWGGKLVRSANARLRVAPPEFEGYSGRRSAYAESIVEFNDRWLWKSTRDADFRLSRLNRHHALHALGPESFYRARDCHRLFLYLETFSEMLVFEGSGPKDVFVPLEEPVLERRHEYYVRLVENPPSLVEACQVETSLLSEHPFFSKETDMPRLTGMMSRKPTQPNPVR